MRAITIIAVGMLAASCVSPGGTTQPVPAPTTGANTTYQEVKALAVQACSYVPTISEVSLLIPQFSTASEIAKGMCAVLKAVGAKRGAPRGVSPPMLKGVALQGHFE